MASTDLVARFTTRPALEKFVAAATSLTDARRMNYEFRMISAIRDYPWQVSLAAVHPDGVDLAAVVETHEGQIISIARADTP